ncbi:MAG: C1 family peptidase [Prevotellaceae bacterium]|jgi:hypothetical protein|nr:C1 family peptidase [Prevotellaceae bacterium]
MNYCKKIDSVIIFIALLFLLLSCGKYGEIEYNTDLQDDGLYEENPDALSHFGWHPDFERIYSYESAVLPVIFNDLPWKVDLSDKLPPAGDQGSYGTCVTWALAYGLRTYMNAVSKNLIAPQLLDKKHQFSPSDLWMSIPLKNRVGYCAGTAFQPVLNALVYRGVTTMHNANYSAIKCKEYSPEEWTQDAANYKIAGYRIIDRSNWSVNSFKTYLSQGYPVCIGTRLGDRFRVWKSGVLDSDTYRQSMYHAMLLVGYDEQMGNAGAFKVFNSWGTDWGENGYIWIDYNFFLNDVFLKYALVAYPLDDDIYGGGSGESAKLDISIVDVRKPEVRAGYNTNRRIKFKVSNTGTEPVNSSSRWSIIYMYYNAFDAKDNGVLAHFYYTDQVKDRVPFHEAPKNILDGLQMPPLIDGKHVGGICINQDIPAGKDIASVYYDNNQQYMVLDYYMPPVTGYYYLAMIVDPYQRLNERSEKDNTFVIAHSTGIPYYFTRGIALNMD